MIYISARPRQSVRSFVSSSAVFGFAEPLAKALGDTTLASIMRAMAVLPLIHAFSIAPTAAAERNLRFQSTVLRTIVSLFAGASSGWHWP